MSGKFAGLGGTLRLRFFSVSHSVATRALLLSLSGANHISRQIRLRAPLIVPIVTQRSGNQDRGRPKLLFDCLFVCLFVVIKPKNLYFSSRLGLEIKPLGVYPLGLCSSSCGPGETPDQFFLSWVVGTRSLLLMLLLCRHIASPPSTEGTHTGGFQ